MRIISGRNKGKRLVAPQGLPVRPTTDFAKEALFNVLNNQYYFDKVSVLDLFCGTGNISYEFASRGCTDITSVDNFLGCVQFVKKVSAQLNFSIRTYKIDVYKYLKSETKKFDIIFADPPYDFSQEQLQEIVNICFNNALLDPNAVLIIEHSKHIQLTHIPHFSFERRYGGSVFSFFTQ